MGCGVYWQQIHTVDSALDKLRLHLDIPGISDAYQQIHSLRGQLMAKIGFKFPRTVMLIMRLVGLSPGTVTLWFDIESGWMSEARARPRVHPVYKSISAEVAMTLLRRELTKELEVDLMTPDPYIGE